ncbi:MAG: hypothetical protein J7K69_01185 [Thermotogae bacterium]|nr:hypothetical protein [Thermotogota bacterium]
MIKSVKFLILLVILLLLSFSAFSIVLSTYRYNPNTGRWERVIDTSIVSVETSVMGKVEAINTNNANSGSTSTVSEPKSYTGNSNTSIPLNNSINIKPSPQFSSHSKQWYYYITYMIDSADVNNKKTSTLWAAQTIDCGVVYVWNDLENLYVKYVTNQWLMTETHVNVQVDKPTGNQSPGLFPYKTEYSEPVSEALYMIPLSDEFRSAKKVYILAHAVVFKENAKCEETAWAGDIPSCMEIEISGSKVAWFVKKPGRYFSNVLEMSVKSELPVVVTFSGFSDPKAEDNALISFYSVTKSPSPQTWLTSDQVNSLSFDLISFPEKLYVWQMIIINSQSSNLYKNEGVVTFTLKNVKSYSEIP